MKASARPLFVATILLGSFLLFLVQPLVARLALPQLGGAPAVWNSAMLVYQALLLGGYAYAHAISRLTIRRQALIHLALRFAQQTQIMLGVLLKVLGRNTVIAQLCIAGQLVVFLDNLLRRAAHLTLGAGAVKNTVDDIAAATLRRAFAVILRPGA